MLSLLFKIEGSALFWPLESTSVLIILSSAHRDIAAETQTIANYITTRARLARISYSKRISSFTG
jgi:hypothetical protein